MQPNTQTSEKNEGSNTITASTTPSKTLRISIVFGSIVVGAAIVGVAYLYTESLKTKAPTDLTQAEEDSIWRPEQDFNNDALHIASSTNSTPSNDESLNTITPEFEQQLKKTNIAQYELAVDWLPQPLEIALSEIPYKTLFDRVHKVGTITNGILSNTPIYLMYTDGMIEYVELYAVNEQHVVNLQKWIGDGSDQPNIIEDAISKLKLIKGNHDYRQSFTLLKEASARSGKPIERLAINSSVAIPDGELYQYQQCFFARMPSDLLVEYVVDVPFIDNETERSYGTHIISFTRTDGTYISNEYQIYDQINFGCGSLCSPLKVAARHDSDFVKTGTTADGHDLFVLKNTYDGMLVDLYNQPNTRAFIDTTEGAYEPLEKNKYSYEEFLSMAPILFWKDQLGRWVYFVHSEFLILAEKCKPVIYLYPEKETDVHVEVKPNLGFTKTIPEYKNGWNVTAYPDSTIIDKESQEKFDYLYWTGWVEGYPLIEQGWVVEQKNLPAFFDAFLPKYGLVGKEIEDFKEYWEDDMDDAPYYAVSFVDQTVIDKLSPLALDVAPDTVIRVLMTAMPLDRPIKLQAPRIPETPIRHGFTVAEWGGTILRNK